MASLAIRYPLLNALLVAECMTVFIYLLTVPAVRDPDIAAITAGFTGCVAFIGIAYLNYSERKIFFRRLVRRLQTGSPI